MSGMKKKRQKIRKSTESTSKKPKASSTTQKLKSNTMKTTAKKKTDSKPLATQKNIAVSSSSSANMKEKEMAQSELSLQDVLKNLKKKSMQDQEKKGHGFISLTDQEREVLQKTKKKMGRPRKQDELRKEVVSFRLSALEKSLLFYWAKKNGFTNWVDCALGQAKKSKIKMKISDDFDAECEEINNLFYGDQK